MALEVIEDHLLWPEAIPNGARIIDCGANVGEFSRMMLARFNAECVALEPVSYHCERIAAPIRAMQVAVSGNCGTARFCISDNPLGSSLLQANQPSVAVTEVATTTLPVLMSNLGWRNVDVVKMDIEGAEIGALDACDDETLSAIGQLTVEFHDFNKMVPLCDVKRIVARLDSLGFYVFKRFRGCYYDTLFLNQRVCRLSAYCRVRENVRLLQWGLERRVRRVISRDVNGGNR